MTTSVRKNNTWPEIVELILKKTKCENDYRFKSWLMKKEHIGYHFDYFLWLHAYGIYKKINGKDNDHFTCISGVEGCGKSVLALLLSSTVSPTFSMKHICFSIQDFFDIVNTAEKGDTILLDEGAVFLFSREATSKDNRKVVKSFNLMRQLNLHILVCIPNYMNMDTYIREHRADTLLQIRKSRDTYKGIKKDGVDVVNQCIKKVKGVTSVKLPSGSFWNGYWTKKYPEINDISEEKYSEKKRKHLDMFLDLLKKDAKLDEDKQMNWVKISEFQKLVPIGSEAIIRNIQKGEIPGRKIGTMWYVNGHYYRDLLGNGGNNGLSYYNTEGGEDKDEKNVDNP